MSAPPRPPPPRAPWLIRATPATCVLLGLLTLLPLLPMPSHGALSEFMPESPPVPLWRTLLEVIPNVGFLAACAYGFRTHRLWARPIVFVYMGFALLQGVVGYFGEPSTDLRLLAEPLGLEADAFKRLIDRVMAIGFAAFLVLMVGQGLFAAWYFYRKRSVVAYYRALKTRRVHSSPRRAGERRA